MVKKVLRNGRVPTKNGSAPRKFNQGKNTKWLLYPPISSIIFFSYLTSFTVIRHGETTEAQSLGEFTSHRLLLLWKQSYAGRPIRFVCLVQAHPRLRYFLLHFPKRQNALTLRDHVQWHNVRHSHLRINQSNFPPLNPQQQQVWDVGSQRLITLRVSPYFSANPF